MTPTPGTTTPGNSGNGGNGGSFGPEQAAALLSQATRQARRRFAPSPPWLLATRAVMAGAACGAVWLSVRGQHPYRGLTTADIPILIAFITLNLGATLAVRHRAITGIHGRTRMRPTEITILAGAWAAAAALMAALAAAGLNYSLYPTTTLIIPGLAWAATSAARAAWRNCATGLAVTATGAAGLPAGPAGAWAVAGAGLCAILLANAAATARYQRT
jgi:hypothetical protein